jgi:hypothetical protein
VFVCVVCVSGLRNLVSATTIENKVHLEKTCSAAAFACLLLLWLIISGTWNIKCVNLSATDWRNIFEPNKNIVHKLEQTF